MNAPRLTPAQLRLPRAAGVPRSPSGGALQSKLCDLADWESRGFCSTAAAIMGDAPDPEFRHRFYTEIVPALKARGKALLVVSHDDRYFAGADRILNMADGRYTEHVAGHG